MSKFEIFQDDFYIGHVSKKYRKPKIDVDSWRILHEFGKFVNGHIRMKTFLLKYQTFKQISQDLFQCFYSQPLPILVVSNQKYLFLIYA